MEYGAWDTEVFAHDNLIYVKKLNGETVGCWWNTDPQRSSKIAEVIKNYILIGYNNYYYDNYIVTLMLRDTDPETIKKNSDIIIAGGNPQITVDTRLQSLDCFQQIDVSKPSLKKIEGNMGLLIKESDVDFSIDRPLTEEEKKETEFYCGTDVDATIKVYELRKSNYFEAKSRLLDIYGDRSVAKWNTTTISANLLLDRPLIRWSSMRLPEQCKNDPDIPQEVWDLWSSADSYLPVQLDKKSVSIKEFNNDIQFGFGGLHGAHSSEHEFTNVKLVDVSSMYPSLIINLGILGDSTAKYDALKKQRLAVKNTDKALSDALKIVLNSVYGLMKEEHSMLYNPNAALTVCVLGQIAIFKLSKRLYEAGCTLININTDGIAYLNNGHDVDDIIDDWMEEFNLQMDRKHFDRWIQKDVNNYISVSNGNIKVKGGQVSRYLKPNYLKTNNARILDIALVENLLNGTDPIDTLYQHIDEPILYQYVLQAGRTYKGVYDSYGRKYNNINRVFAAKKDYATPKLFKMRNDGGLVNFPDIPDYMYLWDDDVSTFKDFGKIVDLNHYYKIVKKRLSEWKVGGLFA